jgi:hypothetical protein
MVRAPPEADERLDAAVDVQGVHRRWRYRWRYRWSAASGPGAPRGRVAVRWRRVPTDARTGIRQHQLASRMTSVPSWQSMPVIDRTTDRLL